MLLILLSWIYILFTVISFGAVFSKWLKISIIDVTFTPVLGLFGVTLFASAWAFFGPIALGFHIVLVLLSILSWYQNKAAIQALATSTYNQIIAFSKPIKWLFIISSVTILAQCTTTPYIIDNETYYIQTIKWLNEYGFVKGLANLHLFFGQTSGWHIAQSAYNFSFLYDRFNDLNGFCLLLGNYFAFQKLQNYTLHGKKTDLIFGLLPVTYAFLFQFISAPSPDFPVYLFSFMLFSIYLDKNELSASETFNKIAILALFAAFIKVTAVIMLLFPLFAFFRDYKTIKSNTAAIKYIAGITFVLFVAKNIILTGYPLFPLTFKPFPDLNYKVPAEIMDFFFSKSMMHSFYMDFGSYDDASVAFMAKQYFFHNGIDGIIGLTTVFLVLIAPIVIYKYRLQKSIWTVYIAFICLLVLLCFSSPQYRFYVYFTLFFGLLVLALLLRNTKQAIMLHTLSIAVVAILLFIPVSFKGLTTNPLLAANSTFHFKNLIIPEPNTKYKLVFKGDSRGNMKFNTPIDPPLLWINGNGKLPCVNSEQLNYFEVNFHFMPQQRSHNLADGFYAQKVTGHE